jgi:DNA repair photolyase
MSKLQVVHLFGFLPNMLEWTGNPCVQGCEYCYAKMWKREYEPIDKLINFILKKENEKIGLLPFLIRKRSPISISNRTDIMCAPDWRERLYAIKQLGFPIYLETKLNKDYKDLADIFDKDRDTIYQTITGYNNKYEEHNLISAEEKIEAAKWFNEQGFNHCLGINPFMPDKCSTDDIKRLLDYVKPHGFIMFDYHRPSSGLAKKHYQKEFPMDIMKTARDEIRAYCREKKIDHDIDLFGQDMPFYPEGNLRSANNSRVFHGNHFVRQELAIHIQEILNREGCDYIEIYFSGALKFFDKQINYFKDCIIKHNDYNIHTGSSYKKPEKETFDIIYFLKMMWNANWFRDSFDKLDRLDKEGNMIYIRNKGGFVKFVKNYTKE